jgi:hypothetical protein
MGNWGLTGFSGLKGSGDRQGASAMAMDLLTGDYARSPVDNYEGLVLHAISPKLAEALYPYLASMMVEVSLVVSLPVLCCGGGARRLFCPKRDGRGGEHNHRQCTV